VQHVHIHIIPRKLTGDRFSKNDDIYPELESYEKELAYEDAIEIASKLTHKPLKMDNGERKPRSAEEMEAEAEWLKALVEELDK
jgi:bis(5'-adenosyl)-triphosphatase